MKFIGYIPFGYPSINESLETIDMYYECGCRAIEASFPLENPIGESEMITEYMRKALRECDDYALYLDGIRKVRAKYADLEINLLLFTEVIDAIGHENLSEYCKENNIFTIICPDITDHLDLQDKLSAMGVKFVAPFHYDVDDEELQNCINAKGFVYMQAFPPEWQKVKPGFERPDIIVRYLRENGVKQEIYAGVGIKDFDDVKTIKEAGADGFFVGSSLMKLYDNKEELRRMISLFIENGK